MNLLLFQSWKSDNHMGGIEQSRILLRNIGKMNNLVASKMLSYFEFTNIIFAFFSLGLV